MGTGRGAERGFLWTSDWIVDDIEKGEKAGGELEERDEMDGVRMAFEPLGIGEDGIAAEAGFEAVGAARAIINKPPLGIPKAAPVDGLAYEAVDVVVVVAAEAAAQAVEVEADKVTVERDGFRGRY